MTLQKLASLIAKKEGKKSQARIGDIREVLRVLCDIECDFILQDSEESALGALSEQINKRLEKKRPKK
jgi:hypothetical protein